LCVSDETGIVEIAGDMKAGGIETAYFPALDHDADGVGLRIDDNLGGIITNAGERR
jgi:hypothetical protein